MRRVDAASAGVVAAITAIASWLLPASLHIVTWGDAGPERVALLAPWWWLAGSVAIAVALVLGLCALPARGDVEQQGGPKRATPLLGLALCIVPYLPWLPDWVPVLVALAGPVKWLVVACVVTLLLARLASGESWSRRASAIDARVVFVVTFILYALLGLRSLSAIGLKGDEPHYLIISQSLVADGDLQIENNHRRREYRRFTREDLPPDSMQRGQNGQIYSIHAPGLPALLVPIYVAAGAPGAVLALAFCGAVAAVGVFRLAGAVAGGTAALVTWLGIAFSVPFVPYAWSIFTEMPGAAIVAWAAGWLLIDARVPARRWLGRGIALALMPWLHTKFVIFEAAFAALFAGRLRRDRTAVLALLAPIAISGLAWLAFFYAIYGTPNPEAPYGNYARDWVKLAFVPRGVLGLLFDQKFGVLPYAPVYALTAVGLAATRRSDKRWQVLALVAVFAAFVASSARLYMWWGGWSAPARFLVPAVPLLAPALALAIARLRSSRWSWLVAPLAAWSVLVALGATAFPARLLLFSDAHGVSRLVETFQGSAPLTATLPMFTESEWRMRDLIPRPYPTEVLRAAAIRGRIELAERAGESARTFDYAARRFLAHEERRALSALTAAVAAANQAAPLAPTSLYAEGSSFWTMGTERARVLMPMSGQRRADVTVHIGPAGGTCTTIVAGDKRAEPMQPNETRVLTFDGLPPDATWLPVSVQASRAFRPSDVDPASGDRRLLGCQVQVVLR